MKQKFIEIEQLYSTVHTQVFWFKKRMLFVQETMASTDFSGLFSDLSWCHLSYEGPI